MITDGALIAMQDRVNHAEAMEHEHGSFSDEYIAALRETQADIPILIAEVRRLQAPPY